MLYINLRVLPKKTITPFLALPFPLSLLFVSCVRLRLPFDYKCCVLAISRSLSLFPKTVLLTKHKTSLELTYKSAHIGIDLVPEGCSAHLFVLKTCVSVLSLSWRLYIG